MPCGIDLHETERLGQPVRTIEQPLGLSGHVAFLEVVDELHRLIALGFAHRFENAGLGDATEIVVNGRLPVESDGTSKDIGLSEPLADTLRGDTALIIAVRRLIGQLLPGRTKIDIVRADGSKGELTVHTSTSAQRL